MLKTIVSRTYLVCSEKSARVCGESAASFCVVARGSVAKLASEKQPWISWTRLSWASLSCWREVISGRRAAGLVAVPVAHRNSLSASCATTPAPRLTKITSRRSWGW